MDSTIKHDRVKVRLTHSTLYWAIMIFSLMSVGLAVSYWFGPPATFSPFNINRDLVALGFALYGVWQIIFLNIHRLLMVRIGLAFAFVYMVGWGAANTVQAFAGDASFTLPILLSAIGGLHLKLLTEPAVNPVSRRKEMK